MGLLLLAVAVAWRELLGIRSASVFLNVARCELRFSRFGRTRRRWQLMAWCARRYPALASGLGQLRSDRGGSKRCCANRIFFRIMRTPHPFDSAPSPC